MEADGTYVGRIEMNGWNEDNFLEELMPLLRRERAADQCPEAEALYAVADGETSEVSRNAIAAHAARCPACRDLQQRLQAFEAQMPRGEEIEWEQTDKRLDSWLARFLESDAAVRQVGRRTKESHPRHWWTRLASQPIAWQMRWALVPVAAVALVVCSFLVGRLSAPRPRQLTADATTYRRSAPNPTPAGTVADGRMPEGRPDRELQPSQTAPQTQPSPAGGAVVASRAPGRISSAAAPSVAARESGRPTDTAVLTSPTPSNAEEAPIVPVSPSVPDKGAVETAETSGTAPSVSREEPGAPSSRRAAQSGMRSVMALRGAATARATRVEHSAAISAAPVIRLEAGTRVWIALRSVRPRTDGASEFRGVVLLPVTQAGAVLLARNAEVSGTMTVRNGKKSVQVLGILSAGAQYRLRSAGGEANLRLLGAGEAVEFDAGRVVETWMASASTYEKLSTESRPPE